jgi:hypothetical protein
VEPFLHGQRALSHLLRPLLRTTPATQIYNNNTNGVDELLAYGRVEMGELLTHTNSEYPLRLVNSLQEATNSYIYLEHYDANPKDLHLPLSDRSCIKFKLINSLPNHNELLCEYGEQSFCLLREMGENAFRYNAGESRIRFVLRSREKLNRYELETVLLVRNITENSFFVLRFY